MQDFGMGKHTKFIVLHRLVHDGDDLVVHAMRIVALL